MFKLLGRAIALLLFVVALYTVIYKAVHLPITHDEKSAILHYPNYTVWQIMMFPDNWPSNHIINTLCIKFTEAFIGIDPWMVRMHSILGFVLLGATLYFIASKYFSKSWLLFCLPFFLVLTNPFLLDFFSRARGYGLSNAFMAVSVMAVLFYGSSYHMRWYYLSLVFGMLAAYANFTLLIYWAAINILLFVLLAAHSYTTRRGFKYIALHTGATALFALSFLALCYQPLYKMQSTNQFVYWSRESFYRDTIIDQVRNWYYGNAYPINTDFFAIAAIVIFALAGVYSIYKLFTKGLSALSNPLTVTFGILLLVYAVNMAQAILLGTPYLTTRTAISYYVLFAFVFMFLLREIAIYLPVTRHILPGFFVLFMSYNMYRGFNIHLVREWWYDANTYNVQNYLSDYKAQHPQLKGIDLNTKWIYHPSFDYYCLTGKTAWINLSPYHKEADTLSQTLFYYTENDELGTIQGYTPVLGFENSNSTLLINKQVEERLLGKVQ